MNKKFVYQVGNNKKSLFKWFAPLNIQSVIAWDAPKESLHIFM